MWHDCIEAHHAHLSNCYSSGANRKQAPLPLKLRHLEKQLSVGSCVFLSHCDAAFHSSPHHNHNHNHSQQFQSEDEFSMFRYDQLKMTSKTASIYEMSTDHCHPTSQPSNIVLMRALKMMQMQWHRLTCHSHDYEIQWMPQSVSQSIILQTHRATFAFHPSLSDSCRWPGPFVKAQTFMLLIICLHNALPQTKSVLSICFAPVGIIFLLAFKHLFFPACALSAPIASSLP